jgi:hypothetical protein
MAQSDRRRAFFPRRGWPPPWAGHGARGPDFEAHAFHMLYVGNNLKQIAGLRVATGTEHPHQAFRRTTGNITQFSKSNCGVDEIAQYDLASFNVTGKKVFESFPQKRFPETRITLYARPDCFLEISCQSHRSHLPVAFRCL